MIEREKQMKEEITSNKDTINTLTQENQNYESKFKELNELNQSKEANLKEKHDRLEEKDLKIESLQ